MTDWYEFLDSSSSPTSPTSPDPCTNQSFNMITNSLDNTAGYKVRHETSEDGDQEVRSDILFSSMNK